MSEKGHKIPWTDRTWNPIVGCTKVSAGCLNCYAEKQAARVANMGITPKYDHVVESDFNKGWRPIWTGQINCDEKALEIPLHWRDPRRIFVNSMGDTFHKKVPFEFAGKIFGVAAKAWRHTYQILTKRPERMLEVVKSLGEITPEGRLVWEYAKKLPYAPNVIPREGGACQWPLPNVWLGTTCENQEMADLRIPHLLQCPAAVRFVSAEPLLGDIDFLKYFADIECNNCDWLGFDENDTPKGGLQKVYKGDSDWDNSWDEYDPDDGGLWICPNCKTYDDYSSYSPEFNLHGENPRIKQVIVGAESLGGSAGRECKIEWVRNIVRQCKAAGVAVFVKQIHMFRVTVSGRDTYFEHETEASSFAKFSKKKYKRVLLKYPRDKELFPKDLQCWEYPELPAGKDGG